MGSLLCSCLTHRRGSWTTLCKACRHALRAAFITPSRTLSGERPALALPGWNTLSLQAPLSGLQQAAAAQHDNLKTSIRVLLSADRCYGCVATLETPHKRPCLAQVLPLRNHPPHSPPPQDIAPTTNHPWLRSCACQVCDVWCCQCQGR